MSETSWQLSCNGETTESGAGLVFSLVSFPGRIYYLHDPQNRNIFRNQRQNVSFSPFVTSGIINITCAALRTDVNHGKLVTMTRRKQSVGVKNKDVFFLVCCVGEICRAPDQLIDPSPPPRSRELDRSALQSPSDRVAAKCSSLKGTLEMSRQP